MMNIGRLDHRVTIERFTATQNELGESAGTWAPMTTVWAAVEPLGGRGYVGTAVLVKATTRVRLRYLPGLQIGDRVNHKGDTYSIQLVICPEREDHELVLMCRSSHSA
jgi:SPP1 family predicted phage head-tail adaptor